MTINLLLILTLLCPLAFAASPPQLIIPKQKEGWASPAFAPGDTLLAFTTSSENEIWITELDSKDKPRRVAEGDGIGRRFVFEPAEARIVYRQRAEAHPEKPLRLVSTSMFMYDPAMRTSNTRDIYGPYLIDRKVYYRTNLTSPYVDYEGNEQVAGPYFDSANSRIFILNSAKDTVHASRKDEKIVSFELSPDGTHTAVLTDNSGYRIYVIKNDDGTRMDLGTGWWPSWSGNSKRLIWISTRTDDAPTTLSVFDLETRKYPELPDLKDMIPNTPALNNDGSKAAFVHDGAIYEISVPK